MHFCSLPCDVCEATCIFNGTQSCTQDANLTSTSYDTDDNSFSRVRVLCECGKKRSLTCDTSPVHSGISRTKVDLLCDLFPGFFLACLQLQFRKARVRRAVFLAKKEDKGSPFYPPRKSAAREVAYIATG